MPSAVHFQAELICILDNCLLPYDNILCACCEYQLCVLRVIGPGLEEKGVFVSQNALP